MSDHIFIPGLKLYRLKSPNTYSYMLAWNPDHVLTNLSKIRFTDHLSTIYQNLEIEECPVTEFISMEEDVPFQEIKLYEFDHQNIGRCRARDLHYFPHSSHREIEPLASGQIHQILLQYSQVMEPLKSKLKTNIESMKQLDRKIQALYKEKENLQDRIHQIQSTSDQLDDILNQDLVKQEFQKT